MRARQVTELGEPRDALQRLADGNTLGRVVFVP